MINILSRLVCFLHCDLSSFHFGPWLSCHDRLNSKDKKLRIHYEGGESDESHWGLETEKYTHDRMHLSLSAQVRVTAIRWGTGTSSWKRIVCVAFAAVLSTLSSHWHSLLEWHFRKTSTGGGTRVPAVTIERWGGPGWRHLDVAYQLSGLWRRALIISLSSFLSVAVRYCFRRWS